MARDASEAGGLVRDVQPGTGGRRHGAAHLIDLTDPALTADAVIRALELRPHPEGGHYRETWRDTPADGGRGAATLILFLLAADERSHWHHVDAAEAWLWHAGATLRLTQSADGIVETAHVLGPNLAAGAALQAVVPAGCWQAAESLGAWSLVSCVVAPAFQFGGFKLAAPGWRPSGAGCGDPGGSL
jgi:predicted cupin superfamily sugar epimerase